MNLQGTIVKLYPVFNIPQPYSFCFFTAITADTIVFY